MAKPPEPLDEMLPLAGLVIEARVARVVGEGPILPRPKQEPGARPSGSMGREQTLELEVLRVLRGDVPPGILVVHKPVAPYTLVAGSTGPFLLDTDENPPEILGRYGPDSWPLARVASAVVRHLRR